MDYIFKRVHNWKFLKKLEWNNKLQKFSGHMVAPPLSTYKFSKGGDEVRIKIIEVFMFETLINTYDVLCDLEYYRENVVLFRFCL